MVPWRADDPRLHRPEPPRGWRWTRHGDVFVADTNNSRVVELTPGGVQTTLGFTGLSYPGGVAVDSAGDVFVADSANNRVVELTSGGVQSTVPLTGLSGPQGVALDSTGDMYVADTGNNRVVERTTGGVQSTLPFNGLVPALRGCGRPVGRRVRGRHRREPAGGAAVRWGAAHGRGTVVHLARLGAPSPRVRRRVSRCLRAGPDRVASRRRGGLADRSELLRRRGRDRHHLRDPWTGTSQQGSGGHYSFTVTATNTVTTASQLAGPDRRAAGGPGRPRGSGRSRR